MLVTRAVERFISLFALIARLIFFNRALITVFYANFVRYIFKFVFVAFAGRRHRPIAGTY